MLILRFQFPAVIKRLRSLLSAEESALWQRLVTAGVILSPVNNFEEGSVNVKNLNILSSNWRDNLPAFKLAVELQARGSGENLAAVARLAETLRNFTELKLWMSAASRYPIGRAQENTKLTASLFLSLFIFCESQRLPVSPIKIDGRDIGGFHPHPTAGIKIEELAMCTSVEVLVPVIYAEQFFHGWKPVNECVWAIDSRCPIAIVEF